jgi:hypothetical protein
MPIEARWVDGYPARMQSGANKQAFFKVQVSYADGTPVNDAVVYLYNISTNPATFISTLVLVPTGNGIYGVNPGTLTYGDCKNVATAGDFLVEAFVSRQGATDRIAGVTTAQHLDSCP